MPKKTQIWLEPIAEKQIQVMLEENLLAWLKADNVHDAQLVASFISWAIFGTCLQWVGSDTGITIEETIETVYSLVERVLRDE